MTTPEAVAKLKILLGEAAASSTQRGESNEDFLVTLRAMAEAISRAIDLTIESCIEEKANKA